jgi:hypothetical protein
MAVRNTFCILHSAISAAAQAPIKDRLVGAWKLVSFENIAAGSTRRPGAYDRGEISCGSTRPITSS